MPILRVNFSQGEVTARSKYALAAGEIIQSIGTEYKNGDLQRLFTQAGRKLFGTIPQPAGTPVRGLATCKFDPPGQDLLVALVGNALYSAPLGLSGEFTLLQADKTPGNNILSAAHNRDNWYLVTGFDKNTVLKPSGVVRTMGLEAPPRPPVVAFADNQAASAVEGALNFTANTGFVNAAGALGNTEKDFASATLLTEDDTATVTYNYLGGTAAVGAGRFIKVKYFVPGVQQEFKKWINKPPEDPGYRASVLVEVDFDAAGFITIMERPMGGELPSMHNPEYVTILIPDIVQNDQVQVRFTFLHEGEGDNSATLRVYNLPIRDGSLQPIFTTISTQRHQYAVTELRQTKDDYLESDPSEVGEDPNPETDVNEATLALPVQHNSIATHRGIYRTVPVDEGSSSIAFLGLIAIVDITDTTYVDTYDDFSNVEQPLPLLDLLGVTIGGSTNFYPVNTPPPDLSHINSYKGSLVGIKGRGLFRSITGRPESWPIVLMIQDFPLPQHDNLVSTLQVGDTLLVGAGEIMLAIDDNVQIVDGLPVFPDLRVVANLGLASEKGIANISMGTDKQDLGAWVSHEGINITNGFTSRQITDDADWVAKVDKSKLADSSLGFDQSRNIIVFSYTKNPDADNPDGRRSYAFFHMDPVHAKQNGWPKATWDHFGEIKEQAGTLFNGQRIGYTGHQNRPEVYVEDTGSKDESLAFNANGDIHTVVQSFLTGQWSMVKYLRANLNTTDIRGEIRFDAITSQDSSRYTQEVTGLINLDNEKGANFLINRAGQYLDLTFTRTGQGQVALLEAKLMFELMDSEGSYTASGIAK